MALASSLAALMVAFTETPALAEDLGPVCPKVAGFLAGPFVSDGDTARAIFLAVEAAIDPTVDKTKFSEIVINERRDAWTVFRMAPLPAPRTDGQIDAPFFGGGTLSMTIDKCSSAISNAYYQR